MLKKLLLALLASTFCIASPAVHAAYPDKPIRLIIPFAPGGSTDILGRVLAEAMQPILGQTIIVENKAGAAGNIGGQFVAQSKPDGYTLLMADAGPTVINPSLYDNMPFDPVKDLAPITAITTEHNLMAVNPSVPARTLAEFIQYAKQNPGTISFGSPGAGSPAHLAGALLNKMAGLDMQHVPYKGTGPAVTDLVAGHIHVMIDNMPPLLPHVQSDRLRPIAVPSAERTEAMPDMPTFEEEGLEGYVIMAWKGLMAPAGTPQPVLDKIHDAASQVLQRPDIQKRLMELGAEPKGNTPAEFAEQIRTETAWWANLIKETNTTVN